MAQPLGHPQITPLQWTLPEIGLSCDEIRDAVSLGIRELRLVERDLPENERRGARKTGIYLAEGGA